MGALKGAAYFLISAIGLIAAGGILAFILSASAVIAVVVLGIAAIAFIAFCIREYFEGPTDSGPQDRDG